MDIVPGGRPLDGVLVVALEQAVAAPFATRHLADLGARVIKIERPGRGDFARDYDSAAGDGFSSWFVWLNRSKESVVLDLKTGPGRQALDALIARADVFVCNLAPGGDPAARPGTRPARGRPPAAGGVPAERLRRGRALRGAQGLRPAGAGRGRRAGGDRLAGRPGKGGDQRRRHRRRHVRLQRHPVRPAAARADRPRRHRQGVPVRRARRMDVQPAAARPADREGAGAHRRAARDHPPVRRLSDRGRRRGDARGAERARVGPAVRRRPRRAGHARRPVRRQPAPDGPPRGGGAAPGRGGRAAVNRRPARPARAGGPSVRVGEERPGGGGPPAARLAVDAGGRGRPQRRRAPATGQARRLRPGARAGSRPRPRHRGRAGGVRARPAPPGPDAPDPA